ncbi:MAG: hypothetical protein ACR2QC_01895 [Gammaproteobacteria bacterium]
MSERDDRAVIYAGKTGLTALGQILSTFDSVLDDDGKIDGGEWVQITVMGSTIAMQMLNLSRRLKGAGVDLGDVANGITQMGMQLKLPEPGSTDNPFGI